MRTLTPAESQSLSRYLKQRRELLRLQREELSFTASNELITRIIAAIGPDKDDTVSRLLARRSINHASRAHRQRIIAFVNKLVAASGRRVNAIEELGS